MRTITAIRGAKFTIDSFVAKTVINSNCKYSVVNYCFKNTRIGRISLRRSQFLSCERNGSRGKMPSRDESSCQHYSISHLYVSSIRDCSTQIVPSCKDNDRIENFSRNSEGSSDIHGRVEQQSCYWGGTRFERCTLHVILFIGESWSLYRTTAVY
jgi:hypothetical protein